jgi:hypothetical protein
MHIGMALAKRSETAPGICKAFERYVKSRAYATAKRRKIIDRRADSQPMSLRRIESCSGASIPILTRRPVPPSRVI